MKGAGRLILRFLFTSFVDTRDSSSAQDWERRIPHQNTNRVDLQALYALGESPMKSSSQSNCFRSVSIIVLLG